MDIKRAKPIRFAYDNVFVYGSDDVRPFCLSDKFRRFLLQNAERGLWSRVWDTELTTAEKSVIENGIRALCEEDSCLEQIEDNMAVTVNNYPTITNTNGGCGCDDGGGSGGSTVITVYPPATSQCLPVTGDPGNGSPIIPDVPPGQVPPVIVPGDPVWTDPEEYNAARCKIDNWGWQLIFNWLDMLSNLDNNIVLIGAVIVAIVANAPVALLSLAAGAELIAIAVKLLELRAYAEISDEVFDDIKQWWVDNQQSIICRMYTATSANTVGGAILSEMHEALALLWADKPDWTDLMIDAASRMERVMIPGSFFFRLISSNPPVGYVGNVDCSLCNEPSFPGEWSYIEDTVGVGSSHDFTNDNVSDGFHLTGEFIAGSATNTDLHVAKTAIDGDLEILDTWAAVSFSLSSSMTTDAATAVLNYGGLNHVSQLVDYSDDGGIEPTTVLVIRDGETPPSGTWGLTITVTESEYLSPRFSIGAFEYHPLPLTAVALDVENFTVYPLP